MTVPRLTVVVTVRDEADAIAGLLTSLEAQTVPVEVVVVDAASTDGTVDVVRSFAQRLPLTVSVQPCSRGAGRNIGARYAHTDVLAFIDGDCIADPAWAEGLLAALDGHFDRVAAGVTTYAGPRRFRNRRVPLLEAGQDVTWPSCNLAYPRPLFEALEGFDPDLVAGEDIDLNLRAVRHGARIVPAPAAQVTAHTRSSLQAYLRQAFWYGYGRGQLVRKHEDTLPAMDIARTIREHLSPVKVLRLLWAWRGYRRALREAA